MKLNYRGNAYEVPASIYSNSESTTQPNQKLIYRGQIYNYAPTAARVLETVDPTAPTVTLIYRGVTFKRQVQLLKSYQAPRAINWCYQTVGEV